MRLQTGKNHRRELESFDEVIVKQKSDEHEIKWEGEMTVGL